MKKIHFISFLLFNFWCFSQTNDSIDAIDNDTLVRYKVELQEIVISQNGVATVANTKEYIRLKRRVLKVYPYAKLTAENLVKLNANLAKLKTKRDKKKYFKIVEKYLEKEFEPKLKKLSTNDGKILIKLIHRQTGKSTFHLVKDLKSGWRAFWANGTANLFGLRLKSTYQPFDVEEDYYIETILQQAFAQRLLQKQDPAFAIDFWALKKSWRKPKEATD